MKKKATYEELEKRVLELEQTELKAKYAEKKLDAIFNASPIIIGLSDIETGEFVEVNQTFYDKLCFTPDEVIGRKSTDIIQLDETFRKENIEKLKKDGSLRNAESIIFNKKKEKLHVLFSAQALELENKKYNFATAIDITQLKKFEALQNFQNKLAIALGHKTTLEEILREILTNIFQLDEFDSGGIYLVDSETGNLDFQLHMGLPEKFVKSVKQYDADDIRTQMVMKGDLIYLKAIEAPDPIREDLQMDNILSLVVVPIKFGGEVIGSINLASHSHEDISDFSKDVLKSISNVDVGGAIFRVLTEDRIRKSEEKYRDIFENLMDVYFKSTFDGVFEDISPSAETIFGYSATELIGNKTELLYQNPKDRQGMLEILKKNGKIRGFELLFKKKNGMPCHVSINADLNFNKDGEPYGLSGTIRDITEWKQAEREKLIAQEIGVEQEKHALVGQIAGQMAHDFNNILGIIMGNTELSMIDCEDNEIKKTLELIFEQTVRGKNLTKNLVAYAKDQEPKQEFFFIDEKINLILSLLKKDLDGINVIKEHRPGVPELLADPGMIENVVVNLIQNSIHAVSLCTEPEIIIRTYYQDDQIGVEIQDNGCGIPKDSMEEIFKPSFSLKGTRDKNGMYKQGIRGTGFGMANVKKYIEQHNGTISIDSELQKGTKVTICLPIVKKSLTKEEIVTVKKGKISCEKYLLIVEDEQAISDVQYRILTQEPYNHKVDIAGNAQIAIDLLNRNEYDLISLDYMLPGSLSGMDVYDHIRQTNKTVPILFISGNIEFLESIKGLQQKDSSISHLPKPCLNIDYVNLINKMLGDL